MRPIGFNDDYLATPNDKYLRPNIKNFGTKIM